MESTTDDVIHHGTIALSLSGGGHRASLFTLGGLVALVDSRLNEKVSQISSVSGGSITNGFIATHIKDFSKVTTEDFDEVARDLVSRVREGVLTRGMMVRFFGRCILLSSLTGTAVGWSLGLATIAVVGTIMGILIGLIVLGVQLLLAGRFVERLLDKRYFSDLNFQLMSRLQSSVEHVFCMTDLSTCLPAYASTYEDGVLWRRDRDNFQGRRFPLGDLTVSSVVRASAAFPGIPPLKLLTSSGPTQEVMFLSDGGLWNNLGHHVLREDYFWRGKVQVSDDPALSEEMPTNLVAEFMPLIVVNASRIGATSPTRLLQLPILGSVAALIRQMKVLSTNTVAPRLEALRRQQQGDMTDEPTVVADIATALAGVLNLIDLQITTLEVAKRRSLRTLFLGSSASKIATEDPNAMPEILQFLAQKEAMRSESLEANLGNWIEEMARADSIATLLAQVAGERAVIDEPAFLQSPYAQYGTDLAGVSSADAFDLVYAGYLTTYLCGLAIEPSGDPVTRETLPDPVAVRARLRHVCGLSS